MYINLSLHGAITATQYKPNFTPGYLDNQMPAGWTSIDSDDWVDTRKAQIINSLSIFQIINSYLDELKTKNKPAPNIDDMLEHATEHTSYSLATLYVISSTEYACDTGEQIDHLDTSLFAYGYNADAETKAIERFDKHFFCAVREDMELYNLADVAAEWFANQEMTIYAYENSQ